MNEMKVLMHICCGPCAIYPVQQLRREGFELLGYFANPNIHPFQEYAKRLEGAEVMAGELQLPLEVEQSYHPEDYFREVAFREDERCRFCYLIRLRQAAEAAVRLGCDGFTTSLLVSPWQKHDLLYELGEAVGRERNVPFLYYDWRRGFSEGRRQAKEMGLYRQQYCGCLYSERERYDLRLKDEQRDG
jgi:predicted adenine nucleotide alpha hydrolase (AANH) superfamily ATPase